MDLGTFSMQRLDHNYYDRLLYHNKELTLPGDLKLGLKMNNGI